MWPDIARHLKRRGTPTVNIPLFSQIRMKTIHSKASNDAIPHILSSPRLLSNDESFTFDHRMCHKPRSHNFQHLNFSQQQPTKPTDSLHVYLTSHSSKNERRTLHAAHHTAMLDSIRKARNITLPPPVPPPVLHPSIPNAAQKTNISRPALQNPPNPYSLTAQQSAYILTPKRISTYMPLPLPNPSTPPRPTPSQASSLII